MEWGQCRRCREWKLNPQNCDCTLFYCWYDDTKDVPDEMREIYASDYDDAAETMAKKWFEGEFDASPMTIFVKQPDDDELREFFVEPEVEITFNARAA